MSSAKSQKVWWAQRPAQRKCQGWEWAAGEERVGSPVAGQGQGSRIHRGLVSEARSLFRTSSFSLINRLHQGRGISLVAF